MDDSDSHPWWKGATFFQMYPRSFADGNRDGVGDLQGIRQHLDHLQKLGVEALWISPIFRSPMVDAGYDISDYCDIDPVFGNIEEIDLIITEAHARDIKVLLDFVPNHTSNQHPWFLESRSSRDNPKRDWYIWRDEPNNWRAKFTGGSAWTWDEATEQFYLHLFFPEQPDLNWRNPEVIEAMHNVLHFWLERGVDGFRIDVAHCTGKDPNFADDSRSATGEPLADFNDQPYTHEILRGIRQVLDSYPGDRTSVGEVNIRSTHSILRYYGKHDELHMAFNFNPLDAPWDPVVFRTCIREVESLHSPAQTWPTWVLSNHDITRHRSRYGGSLANARAAAVMLLTLRGSPFIYQGEELGLEDAVIMPDQVLDQGGRDGCRAPIPWTREAPHGWEGQPTWLPFPPDAGELSVEAQYEDSSSTFSLYRQLIQARKESRALRHGSWEELPSHPEVLAYRRQYDWEERIVCINFADAPREFPVEGNWLVEIASDNQGATEVYSGLLQPSQGLLLRPVGR